MSFAALMYHEIRESHTLHPGQPSPIDVKQAYQDLLPAPLFVTLENFRAQMEYLFKNGYHTLTLEEVIDYYYRDKELPAKSVLLTFDDCYQSIRQYAYPILKEYSFHAVAFVVTGWLHSAPKTFQPEKSVCMSEAELAGMRDVFEYANHTDQFHTRSGEASAMMLRDDQAFSEDLDLCSAHSIIRAKTVFAYPFGFFTDRNVALLRNKGFHLAFTSENGRNDKAMDPLLLNRNAIPYFMEFTEFQNILG